MQFIQLLQEYIDSKSSCTSRKSTLQRGSSIETRINDQKNFETATGTINDEDSPDAFDVMNMMNKPRKSLKKE